MSKVNNNRIFFEVIKTIVFILFIFSITEVVGQNKSRKDMLKNLFLDELYKNPDKAITTANELLKISNDGIDDKIKAYKLISDGYSAKRDYQKALDYLMKSNDLLYLSKNKLLKISVSTRAGILYHQLKIYDKAIQSLDQAEQYILEYPKKDSTYSYLGRNYIVRGFIYKEKLNPDIAIEFFDKGIVELTKVYANSEKPGISIAKYNKGNCYILLFEYDKAIDNFQESFDYADSVNAKSLKAFALKGLAKVKYIQGNYNQAIILLQQAQSFSVNINDLILNKEIYEGLSENYLALRQWNLFQKYNSLLSATKVLINSSERKSIESSLVNKKAEIKSDLSKEIPRFYAIIVFFFGLIVLSIIVFLFFRKKSIRSINALNIDISNLQNEKLSDKVNK